MLERSLPLLLAGLTVAVMAVPQVRADDGEIDPRNANYSYTVSPERHFSSIPLKVTYNSRSLHNAAFGFGWCSDIGTTLTPRVQGLVVAICGDGAEVTFTSPTHESRYQAFLKKYDREFKKQIQGYDDLNSDKSKLIADYLAANPNYSWYDEFEIESYTAGPTTVLRRLGNGVVTQIDTPIYRFDRFGRLIRLRDSRADGDISAHYFGHRLIGLRYGNNELPVKIEQNELGHVISMSTNGKQVVFSYWQNPNIAGTETLSQIKLIGKIIRFDYSSLYNMTRRAETDSSVEEITYDEKNDWALTRRVNNECGYTYTYTFDPANPKNHYFSNVVEKCKGSSSRVYQYEFDLASQNSSPENLDKTTARVGDRAISYDSGTRLFQRFSDGNVSERRVLVPVGGHFIALSQTGVVENVVDARCQAVARRTAPNFLSVQFSNDCMPFRVRWQGHGNFQLVYDEDKVLSAMLDVTAQQTYRIIRDPNHQITAVEKVGFWIRAVGGQSRAASISAPADADLRRLADVLMKVRLGAIANTVSLERNDPFVAWCQCTLPLFPPQVLH
jgi:hypothetical protein